MYSFTHYPKHIFLLFFLLINTLLPQLVFAKPTITVCHSVFSPWKMLVDGVAQGPGIEIVRAASEKVGLEVGVRILPFKRCLAFMENGEVDVMTGLLKSDDRLEYIDFIEPPYKTKSNKAFYMLKSNKVSIRSYEDLRHLVIGTSDEAKYFSRFDQDNALVKESAPTVGNTLSMLVRGRVDAVITTDSTGDYCIQRLGLRGKVRKEPYQFDRENPVYIALSRRSSFGDKKDDFIRIVAEIIKSGEADLIIKQYFSSRDLPLPEYK